MESKNEAKKSEEGQLTETLMQQLQNPPLEQGESRRDGWRFERVDGYYVAMENVRNVPFERQEHLLMRDLIYACTGVPASHIKPDLQPEQIGALSGRDMAKVRFKIDESFSSTLRGLAGELLPLIGHYIAVQSFVEESSLSPGGGNACQALAAALQQQLQTYYEQQAQLDTDLQAGKLTLQRFVQQLRPVVRLMRSLAQLANAVRLERLTSAELLSRLDRLVLQGEPQPAKELRPLLQQVAAGYMKTVQLWTQKGILFDPQRDFFIEDTEQARALSSMLLAPHQCCHAYWAKRYRLHMERLPSFLRPQATLILNAGKYLNVLRQCNVQLTLLQEPLAYEPGCETHVELIRSSYELPAGKLLDVLRREQQLLLHLGSLHGLLLQPSAFMEHFVGSCEAQLQGHVDRLRPERLQSLLKEALQGCQDANKELLRCQLMTCDVASQLAKLMPCGEVQVEPELETDSDSESLALYGYEALTLGYEAKWPLSLVLHAEALAKLQLLQRVLFLLRFVQRQLKRLSDRDGLRLRMLNTMASLEQYMSSDVIGLLWPTLLTQAQQARHIDELIAAFELFLDSCVHQCLLPQTTAYVRAIFTLGRLCLGYGGQRATADAAQLREYEQEFASFLESILALIQQLVDGGNGGESCQLLLQRLQH